MSFMQTFRMRAAGREAGVIVQVCFRHSVIEEIQRQAAVCQVHACERVSAN